MIYKEYLPSKRLQKYINKFWYLKGDVKHLKEKIFPMPLIHLIINLGEPYKLYTKEDLSEYVTVGKGFISGIQERYLVIENPSSIHHIGVEFKPFGLYPFVQDPIVHFSNAVRPADAYFKDIPLLEKNIIKEPDIHMKFQLFEDYLHRQCWSDYDKFDVVADIVGMLIKNPDITLKDVANKVRFSQKHAITMIKQSTGTTPKALALLYKFQNVIESFAKQKPRSWSSFAMQTNFYDQSGFIKKFKRFTGFTPEEYLQILKKHNNVASFFTALDSR